MTKYNSIVIFSSMGGEIERFRKKLGFPQVELAIHSSRPVLPPYFDFGRSNATETGLLSGTRSLIALNRFLYSGQRAINLGIEILGVRS